MGRVHLVKTDEFFYHVTNRSNQQTWYQCPLQHVWQIALKSLIKANELHEVEIAQFVLMNNHYHMLLRTPKSNIDKFMYEFGKRFSFYLRQATKLQNRMFAGRYKWSIINDHNYYFNVYRYIYQNPLRAGIVDKCENYPFSTLYYQIRKLPFSISLNQYLEINDEGQLLSWLNQSIEAKDIQSIRGGLKKWIFIPGGTRNY